MSMTPTPLTRVDIPTNLVLRMSLEMPDTSIQSSIVVLNSVFLSLVLLTTALRFWVRYGVLRAGGLDDLLMILALIFAVFLSIASLVGGSFGLGHHIWTLSPADPEKIPSIMGSIAKSLVGCYFSYTTAITFTKLSIMATYFRIFPPGNLRKIVVALALAVFGFWVASIFAIVFNCVPLKAAWDITSEGRCYNIVNFFTVLSSFNIVTDLLLIILPVRMLWSLGMPKSQRVILLCLFCGGAFASLASILRLTKLKHLSAGTDMSYQIVPSLIWSVVEVDTGIICASVSTLRPLGKYMLPGFLPYPQEDTTATTTTNETKPLCKSVGLHRSSSTSTTQSIFVTQTFIVTQEDKMKELPPLPPMSPDLTPPVRFSARHNFRELRRSYQSSFSCGSRRGSIKAEKEAAVAELSLILAPSSVVTTEKPMANYKRFSERSSKGAYRPTSLPTVPDDLQLPLSPTYSLHDCSTRTSVSSHYASSLWSKRQSWSSGLRSSDKRKSDKRRSVKRRSVKWSSGRPSTGARFSINSNNGMNNNTNDGFTPGVFRKLLAQQSSLQPVKEDDGKSYMNL